MDAQRESDIAAELAEVVRQAEANVWDGGGPFAAAVVLPDGRRFTGRNRVTATCDPTAHAEVVALREACRALGAVELPGAVLYASCEPCPMCLGAVLWARVAAVYHAADRDDAAAAGFDDAAFYRQVSGAQEVVPVRVRRIPAATGPFAAWLRNPQTVPY